MLHGIVDTQDVAKSHSSSTQKVGLKALAERLHLGITLTKSKRVERSNWENFPLTLESDRIRCSGCLEHGLKVFKAMEQRGKLISSVSKKRGGIENKTAVLQLGVDNPA